jgi:hypothetical protein
MEPGGLIVELVCWLLRGDGLECTSKWPKEEAFIREDSGNEAGILSTPKRHKMINELHFRGIARLHPF